MIHYKILVSLNNERHSYPILIGQSLFDFSGWLPKHNFSQIVIVTDDVIKNLYGLCLQEYLQRAGYTVLLCAFTAGEKSKNYKTKQRVEAVMHKNFCDRDTLLLALGGGVVGDLTGFIAATFLRGIAYVQIPTSLLAMADSSVGGKTGINTKYGKNLIGSIYQPLCVLADTALLKTLPKQHLINGLIECIKMFLTHDAESFHYLEANLHRIEDHDVLNELILRATRIKAAVVSCDEKEQAERSTLNFGHTIGHALEKLTNYDLLHGYAVAYGILVEITIAHLLGLLSINNLLTIKQLMSRLDIHALDLKKYDFNNFNQLIQATKNDKKMRLGQVKYVLLTGIGRVHVSGQQFTHAVDDNIVMTALEQLTRA